MVDWLALVLYLLQVPDITSCPDIGFLLFDVVLRNKSWSNAVMTTEFHSISNSAFANQPVVDGSMITILIIKSDCKYTKNL